MPECYSCKAKQYCIAAAQPGSVICMINRMRYGGTHADDTPTKQTGTYCQYCGKKTAGNWSAEVLQQCAVFESL